MLTPEQQRALNLIMKGENVLLSGPGGAGKTYLIKHIYEMSKNIAGTSFAKKNIGVTAMTGVAATLIQGSTLHSFLGIGLGQGSAREIITRRGFKQETWKQINILVIDEISMLTAALFDTLETIARRVRNTARPFGGIQLILSGDFLQLPCIQGQFCFRAESWESCIKNIICFDKILRQNDVIFQQILNRARIGELTEDDINFIKTKSSSIGSQTSPEQIKPTFLYCKNVDVDKINLDNLLNSTKSNIYSYKQRVLRQPSKKAVSSNIRDVFHIQDEVLLAAGAQVMLCVNLDTKLELVNGSRGVVIGFEICNEYINRVSRCQCKPLCLCTKGFDSQTTTALNAVYNTQGSLRLPIIKFSKTTITVKLHVYEKEEYNHVSQQHETTFLMVQLPIRLAYATTIHKSIGMTLDHVYIDFADIFEYGQAYVALSRTRLIENLYIRNIKLESFKTNPIALEFYKKISAINDNIKNACVLNAATEGGGGEAAPRSSSDEAFDGNSTTEINQTATGSLSTNAKHPVIKSIHEVD